MTKQYLITLEGEAESLTEDEVVILLTDSTDFQHDDVQVTLVSDGGSR